MTTVVFLTAIVVLAIGVVVLWANPRRFQNQVFLAFSVLVMVWLGLVYEAMKAWVLFAQGIPVNPIPWHRANAAIAAFVPYMIWLLKESLVTTENRRMRVVKRSLPWFGLGVVLALSCYSESFLLSMLQSGSPKRGPGYLVYICVLGAAFLFLVIQAWRDKRAQVGIRRVEVQFLIFNLGLAGLLSATINTVSVIFHIPAIARSSPLIVLAAYSLTAWAITFHRIFDARQVFLSLGQRAALIILLGFGIFALWQLSDDYMLSPLDLLLPVAICTPLALWFDRKSREWLDLGGQHVLAEMRAAVIGIARTEPHSDRLRTAFESLLRKECGTADAALLFDQDEIFGGGNYALRKAQPAYPALCAIAWATPESLQRRRSAPGRTDLRQFLDHHSLALIATVPAGSLSPSLLVALGTKTNQSPFTYPEVQRVQNVVELMDSILARSRLATQAALNAKMEHLAMMSRGLAHDLKNLITPISSFLVHTDGRYASNSAEEEVHAAAKRSVRVMTDYVRESLFFANRLTPNFEAVDLSAIFEAVRGITGPSARSRGVALAVDRPEVGNGMIADAVLVQRLLGNLVTNAIDACTEGNHVTLSATPGRPGWIRFNVVDDGCGISGDNLTRIFDPYFTTKEFGEDVRGFGLGLTICHKIVELHHGTIAVQSEVGRGTRVAVDLPIAAPT